MQFYLVEKNLIYCYIIAVSCRYSPTDIVLTLLELLFPFNMDFLTKPLWGRYTWSPQFYSQLIQQGFGNPQMRCCSNSFNFLVSSDTKVLLWASLLQLKTILEKYPLFINAYELRRKQFFGTVAFSLQWNMTKNLPIKFPMKFFQWHNIWGLQKLRIALPLITKNGYLKIKHENQCRWTTVLVLHCHIDWVIGVYLNCTLMLQKK